jgi:ketosteroid isomerase-like protein
MSRAFLFMLMTLLSLLSYSQSDSSQIRLRMQEQEQAWNRGDLREFMSPYWNDERLMFIGSKGITYGWKNTLANYERSYSTREKMGQLSFTILSIQLLSADHAFVTGKWQLERGQPIGGHFTLLWRKIGGKWVIVADHTS